MKLFTSSRIGYNHDWTIGTKLKAAGQILPLSKRRVSNQLLSVALNRRMQTLEWNSHTLLSLLIRLLPPRVPEHAPAHMLEPSETSKQSDVLALTTDRQPSLSSAVRVSRRSILWLYPIVQPCSTMLQQ